MFQRSDLKILLAIGLTSRDLRLRKAARLLDILVCASLFVLIHFHSYEKNRPRARVKKIFNCENLIQDLWALQTTHQVISIMAVSGSGIKSMSDSLID